MTRKPTSEEARWIPFDEDLPSSSLPRTPDDFERLEATWSAAWKTLRLPGSPGQRTFALRDGTAWMNIAPLEGALGTRLRHLPRLLRGSIAQLHAERYLIQLASPINDNEARVQSLALGVVRQILLARMPIATETAIAGFLAAPHTAPAWSRRTLQQLERVQKERTVRSPSWEGFFSGAAPNNGTLSEEAAPSPEGPRAFDVSLKIWRAHPICLGQAAGPLWIAGHSPRPAPLGSVRVFARALPETVGDFEGAAAILFIRGSVLSHAATVARERGIPSLTALDSGFLGMAIENPGRRVTVIVAARSEDCSVAID